MPSTIIHPKIAVQKPTAILMSLQRVQEEELNIVSQNLANAHHAGYKAFMISSHEAQYKTKDKAKISYVSVGGTSRDLTEGVMKNTGSPLDFCLTGSGHFGVQTDKGIRYTRNGRFTRDEDGRLVTHNRHPVVDANGNTIMLPADMSRFQISQTGIMSIDEIEIGQIGVFLFKDEQNMKLEGNSLLASLEEPEMHPSPVVLQGGYEESNVSPINASIQLITIMHRFEEAQKLIENHEQLQRETMNAKAAQA